MQPIVGACGCHPSKQSDVRDRELVSILPIPYCATSLLYAGFTHCLRKFGHYGTYLVGTCGLNRFTRAFPFTKKITGEKMVKILVQ